MAKRRSQSRLWFLLVAFDDYGQTLPQSLPVQRPRATVLFLLSSFLPSCWIRFYTSLSLQRMRTGFLSFLFPDFTAKISRPLEYLEPLTEV